MIQTKIAFLKEVLQMAIEQGTKIAQKVQISRVYDDPQWYVLKDSDLPKQYWYNVVFIGVDVNQIFALQKKTREKGVRFDSSYSFPDKQRFWNLDWSFEFTEQYQKIYKRGKDNE